jgi:Uma2 family endonuclease
MDWAWWSSRPFFTGASQHEIADDSLRFLFDVGAAAVKLGRMNALVEQIIKAPTFPEIVDELQARLAKERARRQKFYEEMVEGQKMEFINGEIVVHSPAKLQHIEVKDNLYQLLQTYVRIHQLGRVMGEKALCVFPRNDYEPDVCFFGREQALSFQPRQLKFPPPGFIAEVLSDSTEETDRGEKFQDYQAHGVGEYWIIDPETELVEQYLLRESSYELTLKSGSGEVGSVVVSGFLVPVRALFDAQMNLAILRQLLAAAPK